MTATPLPGSAGSGGLRTIVILGFFALLAAVFFGRALFTGAVLVPVDDLFLYPPWRGHAAEFGISIPHNHLIADTILQNYSWKMLATKSYAAGQLPLWNPYILAGQPFLAAGQNGSLYPPGLLYYLLPGGQAYGWFVALHLVLGAALTYWLVRVLDGSPFGGLIAGVTFAFCGYLIVSAVWPMVISTAVWLPGILATVELLVQRMRARLGGRAGERGSGGAGGRARGSIVALALVGAGMVTMQFLAGHLEMSLYLLISSGLYGAFRLSRSHGRPLSHTAATGALLLGMISLGALGAAAQLVPFAEAISANVRSGQVSYEDVRSYALPRQQLVAFLAPDFFGNPSHHAIFDLFDGAKRYVDSPLTQAGEERRGTEWGSKNYVEGTAYLAILPILLAAVALLVRRDGPTWALAALAAISMLLAFGTPLYGLLFFGLPGVNQLHTPFRWIYPYSLCLAVLAGLGATAIGEGRLSRSSAVPMSPSPRLRVSASPSPEPVAWLAIGLGGVAVLGLLAAWALRGALVGLAERGQAAERSLLEAFPDPQALYSYEWANLLSTALLLLASGLALLAFARGAPGAKVLALGLLIGDLFSFGMGFNSSPDPAPLSYVPPEIQAIKSDDGLFRIATLGPDDTLPPNTNMLFGLHDIRGYDTIILRDYVDYLGLIEPQTGLLYSKVSKLLEPRSLDSSLLDLLNLKYVLTTLRIDDPDWELAHAGQVRVYRNNRVLPRAFLVEQAIMAADGVEARELLARPEFNPRQQVILEGISVSPSSARAPGRGFEGAVGPVPRIVLYEPNRVTVEAVSLRPSYLVLSDMSFAGWTVRVNGVEQPVLRANRIFRAVELPAGSHQVTFEYKPLSFRLGALLSGLAIALAALILLAGVYARLSTAALAPTGPVGRVLKNSLFPLGTGLLNRALDFAFALVYLRVLGPQGTGAYTFAIVVVGYFDILVNFGLGTLLTREVARAAPESDRYFGNTLAARLGLATLALLAALGLAGPLAGPLQINAEIGLAIVLLTLGMLPGALASTASAMFMARERMEVPAVAALLATLVKVALGVGVLMAGWGIVGLAAVSLTVNVLNAAVLSGLMLILLGRPRLGFQASFILGLLTLSWPLMLNNLLNSLFFRIDAVLLKPLAGEVALGHYATAYKFIDGLQIIPSSFVLALFPILSRQAANNREELAHAFGLGLKVLLALALPISVGTTLLADPIISLFAGRAFLPESALALQVLIWFVPFSFVNGLTQYVLIALNRQRWITLSFLVGAIANLALNLWAIPLYSFMGAAIVTVVSELVLLAPFWYAVRQHLPPVPLLALAWRPALAASVMGMVVFWMRELNPWAAIPLGAVVYGITLLGLGTVTREELRALRAAQSTGKRLQ